MLKDILKQRKKTHGEFRFQATCSQELKTVMVDSRRNKLTSSKREALEMIQHKIARILCGNSDVIDHWDDIAGYATLVADELREG